MVVGLAVTLAPGCIFAFTQNSLGNGTGCLAGALNVPDCWTGQYNLQPNFFVGVPYDPAPGQFPPSFDIRVQRGSDYETFSDGVDILIDDVNAIRPGGDDGGGPGLYGVPLPVAIAAGVTPPGVPLTANPLPSIVHATLYLQSSCQTQDVGLYALENVTLSPDGSCSGVAASFVCGEDGGPDQVSEAGSEAGAGAGAPLLLGHSTITFTSLFDDNEDETNAAERLTSATFDLYFADPRDVAPGGLGPPAACQGHIQGNFSFYFQRGQPAQPFP